MHDRQLASYRRLGPGFILGLGMVAFASTGCAREAPQSFEEQNGLLEAAEFDEATEAFAEVEEAADGLGVHFNDSSCANCHPTPGKALPGGSSAVTELRAGHDERGMFVPAAGGTLITLKALPGSTSEVSALPDS